MKNPATNVKSRAGRDCLYEPLPWILLRAPVMPVERYLNLASEEGQRELLSDARVRAALIVGSTSLYSAIQRSEAGGLSQRDFHRMEAKLRRYLIRMSTRPTPFGLFAGVALAPFGPTTSLTVDMSSVQSRTRPDMAWLMDLVLTAEETPEIRRQLRWVANSAAFENGGRLILQESTRTRLERTGRPVSIRATSVVKQAMSLARTPIQYQELVAELERAIPNATTQKVEELLASLYDETFLVTDLRPPLTIDDPSGYVRDKLAGVDASSEILARLQRLLDAVAAWDQHRDEEKLEKFWSLLEAADVPSDGSKQIPVQADMVMASCGTVGQIIGKETAEVVDLLLRFSAYPRGISAVTAHRQAFLARYGLHREVPLLELLDPELGLGPLGARGYANVGPDPAKEAERTRVLVDLACSCMRDNQRVIELDDALIQRLETSQPNTETAPISLDVNVQVGARCAADIDEGNFILVIGPNLGAQAAGRNLGRFADLVGPQGRMFLEQIAQIEVQQRGEQEIAAEVVYMPYQHRMANVVIRPAICTHEAFIEVTPGVDWSNAVALNELVVGVEQDRFYFRWLRTGQRIRFDSRHMLTTMNGPAAARFLCEAGFDGRTMFTSFDWGPAEMFPFLPRIQKGRSILRPAQWRIHKSALSGFSHETFHSWLESWRKKWNVPRHVSLSVGDNRLILDLDQSRESDELWTDIQQLKDSGSVVMQEVTPDFNEAWLSGSEGHYFSEMIVSMVRRAPAAAQPVRQDDETSSFRNEYYLPSMRNRPPGSEWLFIKLYCSRKYEDDLITDAVLPFAESVVAADLADSWFFIRYYDPERHIRLRFHGSPERLTSALFSRLSEWAGRWLKEGVISKFVFDTYEQELERFGGVKGMEVSEALFGADSRSGAKLLRCIKKDTWPHYEIILLALSVDNLLASLGLTEEERTAWYRKQSIARRSDVTDTYRKHKTVLRTAIGWPHKYLSNFSFGGEISELLIERHGAIAPLGYQLRELQQQGALLQSIDDMYSSFVHLHLNRMAPDGAASEGQILGLLHRLHESLRHAPVARPNGDLLLNQVDERKV